MLGVTWVLSEEVGNKPSLTAGPSQAALPPQGHNGGVGLLPHLWVLSFNQFTFPFIPKHFNEPLVGTRLNAGTMAAAGKDRVPALTGLTMEQERPLLPAKPL